MICPECGAHLREDVPQCPFCGLAHLPWAGEPEEGEISPEEREFERRLYRFPVVTAVVLAICLLAWGAMEWMSSSEDPAALLIFGAKHRGLVLEGQWWRLICASFLHIGWKHLLFNGVALGQLGLFCENIFGRTRFALLYVLCGIGGFLLATVASDAISAGASASLFGLMGAMLVFGWRHRGEIPPFFQRLFTWMLLPWVVLNLGLGVLVSNVDNFAHIGGLVAGLILAWLLDNQIVDGPMRRSVWPGALAGGLCILLTLGAFARTGVEIRALLPVLQETEAAEGRGDVEGMRTGWDRLIAAQPSVGLHYANRAQIALLAGDPEGAEADLRQAIALRHNPVSTRNQLAWLLITRGEVTREDINEAMRLARRSVAQRRGSENLNTLGWALYLRGDVRASLTYLESALALGEPQGILATTWETLLAKLGMAERESAAFDLYMLAMANHALGDSQAAQAYLARADAAAVHLRSLAESLGDDLDRMLMLDELRILDGIAQDAHTLIPSAPEPLNPPSGSTE